MNKKALITLIIGVVIVVIIILLLLRSCTPRVKDEEGNEITPDTTAEKTLDDQYKDGFINANIFFTCEILKDPTIKENAQRIEDGVHEAYAKYGLPVDNDAKMLQILDKYKDDAEVTTVIKTNASPCRSGQEPIFVK